MENDKLCSALPRRAAQHDGPWLPRERGWESYCVGGQYGRQGQGEHGRRCGWCRALCFVRGLSRFEPYEHV